MSDPLYDQAVEFTRTRVGFSRGWFQRVMRVGFVKRDALLLDLEDAGVLRRASNDRDYFLVVANNGEAS